MGKMLNFPIENPYTLLEARASERGLKYVTLVGVFQGLRMRRRATYNDIDDLDRICVEGVDLFLETYGGKNETES